MVAVWRPVQVDGRHAAGFQQRGRVLVSNLRDQHRRGAQLARARPIASEGEAPAVRTVGRPAIRPALGTRESGDLARHLSRVGPVGLGDVDLIVGPHVGDLGHSNPRRRTLRLGRPEHAAARHHTGAHQQSCQPGHHVRAPTQHRRTCQPVSCVFYAPLAGSEGELFLKL